ncbi:hypothetical protein SUGI_1054240, partial [Cryptomeria japonica]
FFVVVFVEGSEGDKILNQENWFIDSHPLYLQPWAPNFDHVPLAVYEGPIGTRMYNLPIEYWGDISLKKISRTLGTLLEIDEEIIENDLYSYARLRIAIVQEILKYIMLVTSEEKWRQQLEVEKEIVPCSRCGSKFYFPDECKMFVRRAWGRQFKRPKQWWVEKDRASSQFLLCMPQEEKKSGVEDHIPSPFKASYLVKMMEQVELVKVSSLSNNKEVIPDSKSVEGGRASSDSER